MRVRERQRKKKSERQRKRESERQRERERERMIVRGKIKEENSEGYERE